jgi:hypothetical protein
MMEDLGEKSSNEEWFEVGRQIQADRPALLTAGD